MFLVISVSDDSRHNSDKLSSVNLFLNGVSTRFIVETLLSASAEEKLVNFTSGGQNVGSIDFELLDI